MVGVHPTSPEAWNLYAHAAVRSGAVPRCLRVLARFIAQHNQHYLRRLEQQQQQRDLLKLLQARASAREMEAGAAGECSGGTAAGAAAGSVASSSASADPKRIPVLLMSGLMHSLQGAWVRPAVNLRTTSVRSMHPTDWHLTE